LFIFAGAVGNMINRVFLGYVIDYLELPNWPTFNLADILINIGVVLLIVSLLKTEK
jgi:signal peptidase II